NQRCERRLVLVMNELVEQLTIAQPGTRRRGADFHEVAKDRRQLSGWHVHSPPGFVGGVLPNTAPGGESSFIIFLRKFPDRGSSGGAVFRIVALRSAKK